MYATNLGDKQSKGKLWGSLVIDRNTALFFLFFRVEYIPQEVLSKVKNKSIKECIFRIQSGDVIADFFILIS